ncbi:MAG TPA: hypothetical protein PKL57_15935 [Candidatus Wallbacteria bacterium]|nr:hypothetical protein [Candidatus Wallbacteria bacterium]
MEKTLNFFKNLDRRIIFLFIAIAVVVTLINPMYLDINISKNARTFVNVLNGVNENDSVIVSFDYAASGEPELKPMAYGILYKLFQRKAKVIIMGFWDQGPGLADKTVKEVIAQFERDNPDRKIVYGKDYINIGYKAGGFTIIINMSKSIKEIFTTDNGGEPINSFDIMKDVNKLSDIKMVFALTGGNNGLLDIWLPFARQQYNVPVAGGCTSVSAPQFYQYMNSGQLSALLDGFKTAAELLKAIEYTDQATKQTKTLLSDEIYKIADVQSIVHVIIMIFIIIANATYLYEKKYSKQ